MYAKLKVSESHVQIQFRSLLPTKNLDDSDQLSEQRGISQKLKCTTIVNIAFQEQAA